MQSCSYNSVLQLLVGEDGAFPLTFPVLSPKEHVAATVARICYDAPRSPGQRGLLRAGLPGDHTGTAKDGGDMAGDFVRLGLF